MSELTLFIIFTCSAVVISTITTFVYCRKDYDFKMSLLRNVFGTVLVSVLLYVIMVGSVKASEIIIRNLKFLRGV